jgi:hypothetical protein
LIWDPKTKLVLSEFHVVFDDNFETVQPPNPEIKMEDTMDRLFKTSNYKYDEPFGNEHTHLFSDGGVDIHPDSLSPNINTCQESINTASTSDESSITFETTSVNSNGTRSILSIKYIQILLSRNIFPQNRKDDLKSYTHLHGIDIYMHIQSTSKPPNQNVHDMGLSNLHEE